MKKKHLDSKIDKREKKEKKRKRKRKKKKKTRRTTTTNGQGLIRTRKSVSKCRPKKKD